MMWLLGIIAVAIIATGAFLASGAFGEMPELVDDHPAPRLPEGDFTVTDVQQLHFAHALRGYAPHQVNEFLERAQDAITGTHPMTAGQIGAEVFDVVAHGFHMGQVDHVLERLADQFARRTDAEDTVVDEAPEGVEELTDLGSRL